MNGDAARAAPGLDEDRVRRVGRCASCRHARRLVSAKNSEFWLCERAAREPERFVKYPRLPVVHCAGWESAGERPSVEHLLGPDSESR